MELKFLLRTVALFLSFAGYLFFFINKLGIKSYLAPGLAASFIICMEFAAGILNIMLPVTYFLFLGGFFGFALFLWDGRKKRSIWKKGLYTSFPIFFVLLLYGIGIIRFQHTALTNYDDFSHWGIIVKCMAINDRLPTSVDKYITFKSYPPGSACFIYYFSKILGYYSEGKVLFASFFLRICLLTSLFYVAENASSKVGKTMVSILTAAVIVLLSGFGSLFALGVDSLLACFGIYCFLSAYVYREKISNMLWMLSIGCGACVLVKNSGLFFYAIVLLYSFVMIIKTGSMKRIGISGIIWMLMPVLIIWIWQRHVELVFPDGLTAKHSLSVAYQSKVFSKKSSEEIQEEIRIFTRCLFSWNTNKSLILWSGILVYTGILLGINYRNRELRKKVLLYLSLLMAFSIIYQSGILWTYLFSMSHDENMSHDGSNYSRYNSTLVLFLVGFTIVFIYRTMRFFPARRILVPFVSVAMCFVIYFSVKNNIGLGVFNLSKVCNSVPRYQVIVQTETLLSKLKNRKNGGYIIRAVPTEAVYSSYLKHMMRYLTLEFDITVAANKEDDEEWNRYWNEETTAKYAVDLINNTVLKRKR